jgi:hypothetical protein
MPIRGRKQPFKGTVNSPLNFCSSQHQTTAVDCDDAALADAIFGETSFLACMLWALKLSHEEEALSGRSKAAFHPAGPAKGLRRGQRGKRRGCTCSRRGRSPTAPRPRASPRSGTSTRSRPMSSRSTTKSQPMRARSWRPPSRRCVTAPDRAHSTRTWPRRWWSTCQSDQLFVGAASRLLQLKCWTHFADAMRSDQTSARLA